MKQIFKDANILAVLFIAAVTVLIFFKIFTRGLYPIPGDLLVSFYFPWYSGSWEGYNPWTTHKEMLGADSIRQIYPWKEFTANQFKNGQFPLWNPYTFSGQPLLANFQSSVFYPLNIFYFLTDSHNAWILLVVSQPFLGGLFMYMAIRSFKISSLASVFGAVAFMFSSYLVTWMENGNVGASYIWLPLVFWAINNFFEKLRLRYLLVLIASLSLSILGGHPQTAIYVYIAASLFWVYKIGKTKTITKASYFLIAAVASLMICAIQLIPTANFYKNSPISLPFSKEVFDRGIMPFKNLTSFFASDFFGHPANNNFWSQSYGDFTPYFGVVPLIFALWSIRQAWRKSFVKFAIITAAFFILAAVTGPITWFIKTAQLPLLDSTTPSRFISISIFLLIILAAMGFEDFLNNFQDKKYFKKFLYFLTPIGVIYLLLWTFAILGSQFLQPSETWQINLAVTRRNLILPTVMFLSIPVITTMIRIIVVRINLQKSLTRPLLVISLFTVVLIGGIYYTNKFLPVSPQKFIFPDHLLFTWIKNNAKLDRFYGAGTAHIDYNFPTHYKIFTIEGYDTLRLERYAQLLASSYEGKVPKSYLRSDAVIPNDENGYRKRILELLGVKYFVDKEDNPKTGADWHYERFAGDTVRGIYQLGKFQFYERQPVLPRFFQTTKYQVIKNDEEIIQKIYDPAFNLQTLILEEQPPITIIDGLQPITIPALIKYEPNEIIFASNLTYNTLLFLSDAYDSDWQVYVGGNQSKLLRAHYALRAAAVPAGNHQIIFKYAPKSFYQGAVISLSSVTALLVLSVYFLKKRRF